MRLAAGALALLVAGCALAEDFSFALIGDTAYSAQEEVLLENLLKDINGERLAFVAHVGDLSSPRAGSCTNALWAKRRAQFEASEHAFIYTPGDNDWTDCHDGQGVKGGDPAERLRSLRHFFFSEDSSFGKRRIPLLRQAAPYRENARWQMGGVVFLTLHVVGSNNGRGRTRESEAEFIERTRANVSWLKEGFETAKASKANAVMIIQQANMYPEFPPFPGDPVAKPSGFTELREALAREAFAFDAPVVLVHGDSHYFRVDKPLLTRRTELPVDNLTRVETFGSPHHHWVHVTVDPRDPNVFTFRPRIVAANGALR